MGAWPRAPPAGLGERPSHLSSRLGTPRVARGRAHRFAARVTQRKDIMRAAGVLGDGLESLGGGLRAEPAPDAWVPASGARAVAAAPGRGRRARGRRLCGAGTGRTRAGEMLCDNAFRRALCGE